MANFAYYLEKIGEIGYVEQVHHSIVYASGLPDAHPLEVVVFETGEVGQIISLSKDYVEILMLSPFQVKVGTQVARTDQLLKIPIGNQILGKVIDSLGRSKSYDISKGVEWRSVDIKPPGIEQREKVNKPLETGVTMVDLVVPLGKGQRELVIGDRKTGKTLFLLQTILNQSKKGTLCIYAAIGLRQFDINRVVEYFSANKILDKTVVVAASSSDPSGLIFLAPYTAMTIAEYYRDMGKDVLVVLDDLTTHAKYYREITLLAKRFPGRSSYPGDIFYIHSRLLERAGAFKKGSITCLPSAEAILGDISGYIQTNLMAMTDGHVFFDTELFNQGRRPAVNPFLSVTRVGHEAQTPLQKDVSRELSSFLVHNEKMQQFMHFGAEVSESVRRTLNLGEKVVAFFNQSPDQIIPVNVNVAILAGLWAGIWRDTDVSQMKTQMQDIVLSYETDSNFKKKMNGLIASSNNFTELVSALKQDSTVLTQR